MRRETLFAALVAAVVVMDLTACAFEPKIAESIALSKSRAAAKVDVTNPPAFDVTRVTIIYKASADAQPGEVLTGLHNYASWEYWDDHPTFQFGPDRNGYTLRMPKNVGTKLVQRPDGTVEVK